MSLPEWLDEEFELLNARHFESKLPLPKWAENRMRKAMTVSLGQGRHLVWFHPDMLRLMSRAFVSDSMLHELVHVALAEARGDACQHHGDAFVELANTIGRSMGLAEVTTGTDDVLDWPQSVRPPGYFAGEIAVWKNAT